MSLISLVKDSGFISHMYADYTHINGSFQQKSAKQLHHKLIHCRRRYDQVTPLLMAPERVDFKLAVTVYKCLHGLAPQYIVDGVQRVSETDCRQLRSSSTEALVVPYTRLVTAGDCAFYSFGSRLWNSLLNDVTTATTLPMFRSRLKKYYLFFCF